MSKSSKLFKTPRSRARGFVLQGVYQSLLTEHDLPSIESYLMTEVSGFELCDTELFQELLRGTFTHRAQLEALVSPYLDRPLDQVSPIERSVLLMGTYELQYSLNVPAAVVINESINLIKIFGSEDGFRFINGVLDKLLPQLRPNEPSYPKQIDNLSENEVEQASEDEQAAFDAEITNLNIKPKTAKSQTANNS